MRGNLLIEATKNTPKIVGVSDGVFLSIEGSSFPENVRKFYDPVIDWIENCTDPSKNITIRCKFYYMASSSVIAFLKALKKIESIFGKQKMIVEWCYEEGDDDILKIGEDYSQLLGVTFTYKEEEEENMA